MLAPRRVSRRYRYDAGTMRTTWNVFVVGGVRARPRDKKIVAVNFHHAGQIAS